jgi:transposase
MNVELQRLSRPRPIGPGASLMMPKMYHWRHLIENFFCSLKAFRRIATRYEKTDPCFAGVLNLVAAFLASRSL